MSELNLQWLQENFESKSVCLINIGCADITDDSLRFKIVLPDADIWSFECAEYWKQSNLEKSAIYNMNYMHKAVSNFDGVSNFFGGEKTNDSDTWEYRGFLSDPETSCVSNPPHRPKDLKWLGPQPVEVISLNTFCSQHNLNPNFLHIVTAGEEYNILKDLKQIFWPEAIWLESWETYRNSTGNRVPYQVLHDMLVQRNYQLLYRSRSALYVKKDLTITPYTECHHRSSFDPTTQHEIFVQQKIWLLRYNLVKDASWPNIESPKQFYDLPPHVQQECKSLFNLEPIAQIC